jgi:soluble lytic murein transglycosylase-like protein
MRCVLLPAVLLAASFNAPAQSSRELMRAAMERQRAAAALQRESVRRQLEDLRAAPAFAHCDPMPASELSPLLESASKTNDLAMEFIRAVVQRESAFYPCAVSRKGAKGLMQLMPPAIEQFGVSDPFDPKESIEAGAKYLKQLLERYHSDRALALAAYNAGPTAVDEANGIPEIPETRDYVDSILKSMQVPPEPQP